MKRIVISLFASLLFPACAAVSPYNPLVDYKQVDAASVLDAPTPPADSILPENSEAARRGQYMVELLGCGSCHTDGALLGEPSATRSLAGSSVGIAYTNPLEYRYPGVVFAPNITPDASTGIGLWSDDQIVDAIRGGIGRHGSRRILVMPWAGYARLSDADAYAIARYLRSLEPVSHRVPEDVPAGQRSRADFVHFGVYRTR